MLKISQFLPPRKKRIIERPVKQKLDSDNTQISQDLNQDKSKSKNEPGFLGILWDSMTKPEVRGMPWHQYVNHHGKKYKRRKQNWFGRWITPSRVYNNIVGK